MARRSTRCRRDDTGGELTIIGRQSMSRRQTTVMYCENHFSRPWSYRNGETPSDGVPVHLKPRRVLPGSPISSVIAIQFA
jgi:hypothetical protein